MNERCTQPQSLCGFFTEGPAGKHIYIACNSGLIALAHEENFKINKGMLIFPPKKTEMVPLLKRLQYKREGLNLIPGAHNKIRCRSIPWEGSSNRMPGTH